MKTLEINTGIGTVVLTYSESFKKWDFFSGNQEAMKHLEQAAEDMGWVYDPKKRNFITNFIAENAEKFVSKSEEKEVSELWSNENADLEIIEEVDLSTKVNLELAFESRLQAEWNNPIENYGFGCNNIDEVLTHIRFNQLTGYNFDGFKVNYPPTP